MTVIKSFFASRWGIARNPCLKYLLGDALGCEAKAPEDSQMVESMKLQSLLKTQINRLEEMKICLNQRIQPSAAFAEKTAAFWSLTMVRN